MTCGHDSRRQAQLRRVASCQPSGWVHHGGSTRTVARTDRWAHAGTEVARPPRALVRGHGGGEAPSAVPGHSVGTVHGAASQPGCQALTSGRCLAGQATATYDGRAVSPRFGTRLPYGQRLRRDSRFTSMRVQDLQPSAAVRGPVRAPFARPDRALPDALLELTLERHRALKAPLMQSSFRSAARRLQG